MSIQGLWLKFKGSERNADLLLAALIIVVALISFFLGRLSHGGSVTQIERSILPMPTQEATVASQVENTLEITTQLQPTEAPSAAKTEGNYVASKNGTKYHLPWCGSAKSIKEENRVWFASKEEAEKAGYTPAATCKGM